MGIVNNNKTIEEQNNTLKESLTKLKNLLNKYDNYSINLILGLTQKEKETIIQNRMIDISNTLQTIVNDLQIVNVRTM